MVSVMVVICVLLFIFVRKNVMSVVLNMLSCEWVVLVLFLLSLFGMRIYSFIVMNENVSV